MHLHVHQQVIARQNSQGRVYTVENRQLYVCCLLLSTKSQLSLQLHFSRAKYFTFSVDPEGVVFQRNFLNTQYSIISPAKILYQKSKVLSDVPEQHLVPVVFLFELKVNFTILLTSLWHMYYVRAIHSRQKNCVRIQGSWIQRTPWNQST